MLENLENDNKSDDKNMGQKLSKYVSLNVVKHGRPFSDGHFIKEIMQNIFLKLNCYNSIMKSLALSRSTVTKHVDALGICIENVIQEKLKNCIFFSFCLDVTTDINDLSQLVICIRCTDMEYKIFESMFSLETFYGHFSGKLLWEVVRNKLFSIADVKKLAAFCTDGAKVMTGKQGVC